MAEEPDLGTERRITARVTTRSLVEVRIPDWTALRTVYTVNLSLGGMQLSLGARAALGTPVDIILSLPNGERLHLPAKVAHLGPGGNVDVGVRFDDLPASTHQQIQGYLDQLAAGATPKPGREPRAFPPASSSRKKAEPLRRCGPWLCAVALAIAVSPAARAADDASIGRALAAALPADGRSDLLLIEWASGQSAPRVFGATRTTAAPAAIKAALLDPAHYRALIPALEGTPRSSSLASARRSSPGTSTCRCSICRVGSRLMTGPTASHWSWSRAICRREESSSRSPHGPRAVRR